MKKMMIILIAITLTIGGCMPPPRNQRDSRKQHSRQSEQRGPDRRPNTY